MIEFYGATTLSNLISEIKTHVLGTEFCFVLLETVLGCNKVVEITTLMHIPEKIEETDLR